MTYFFFFNDTATTEIYTLSLHDALPISARWRAPAWTCGCPSRCSRSRSEEHTSELQSRSDLVCRLLLEKKTLSQHILLMLSLLLTRNAVCAALAAGLGLVSGP